MVCTLYSSTPGTVCNIYEGVFKTRTHSKRNKLLCLSFRPLFAARMAFLECDTFVLGTARTIGGKSSRNDRSEGIAYENTGQPNLAIENCIVGRLRATAAICSSLVWRRREAEIRIPNSHLHCSPPVMFRISR